MANIALIGAGSIAKFHASAIESLSTAKLVGVFDINRQAAESIAKIKKGVKVYSSIDELSKDKNVEVVDICLPTTLHHDNVINAANAGKHVFCEKPIARTLKQAEEMVAACKKNGIKFMVGHVLRFFPEYKRAKDLISAGKLGKVGMARLSRLNTFPLTSSSWYTDIENSGGVVLDMSIHDFDFLHWCFGMPERVYAQGLTYRINKNTPLDYALVSIRFKNGTIAHVEGSWAETSGFSAKFEIAGEKGILDFDMKKNQPFLLSLRGDSTGNAGVNVPESPLKLSPYAMEIKHFIECIDNDKEPMITGDEAILSLKIALAALESIKSGEVVKF
ncbi:MAG: Gfo/Idh/MocA family oxidoreductase [Elusimicrobiota bacterium]